jgi:hypothetical protein
MVHLDRKFVRVHRTHGAADDGGYMYGTAEERLSQVWELTREVWYFLQASDAEQRLQRDVGVLLEGRVGFLLVGAYALAVHGYPRATKDIDLECARRAAAVGRG